MVTLSNLVRGKESNLSKVGVSLEYSFVIIIVKVKYVLFDYIRTLNSLSVSELFFISRTKTTLSLLFFHRINGWWERRGTVCGREMTRIPSQDPSVGRPSLSTGF